MEGSDSVFVLKLLIACNNKTKKKERDRERRIGALFETSSFA
jgi:hypothetical protein